MQPLDPHAALAQLIMALPWPAHIGVILMLLCAIGAAVLPPATEKSSVLWQLTRRVIDVIGLNVLHARNAGANTTMTAAPGTKLPEPTGKEIELKAGDLVDGKKGKKKSVLEERL
jgi:hypothetical protein